jgi:oligopeptide/dipeptide ABC transporter ATP-binding protein
MPVLEVAGLRVEIGGVPILRGVDFAVEAGRTLGIVGESGCGKTMTGLAVMGMLPPAARVAAGRITLDGRDLTALSKRDWLEVRGQEVAMVMQDPFASLNPMMRVGDQVAEVLRLHQGLGRAAAWAEAVRMLHKVGVPAPEESARKFPHQMSGGQRQRVVIACAFVARPKVLIADEPTTALDVTLQAQILRLLRELQREEGTAVVLVSHDVGVIAAMSDEVAVFYAGQVVESGPAGDVLHRPQHPYTQALLDALPRQGQTRLRSIEGQPPAFGSLPGGCAFSPRCPKRIEPCGQEPALSPAGKGRAVRCWLAASAGERPVDGVDLGV